MFKGKIDDQSCNHMLSMNTKPQRVFNRNHFLTEKEYPLFYEKFDQVATESKFCGTLYPSFK